MANSNIAYGLKPIGTISGADYRGMLETVEFAVGDAVAAFVGDLVKMTGTNNAAGTHKVVAQSTAGDASYGVLVSIDPDFTDEGSLTTNYRPTLTARTAKIAVGQDILYTMQEDSDGNSITVDEAGLNCNVFVGTGNTTTGMSAMELDSTSAAGTSTLNMRLHYVLNAPGNALGDNAEWVVSMNASQQALNQTGI